MRDLEFDEENSHKKKYNDEYSESHEHDQKFDITMNFAENDDQSNKLYCEEVTIDSENKYESFVEFVEIEAFCIKCKTTFLFRNKLHKHLKMSCKAMKSTHLIMIFSWNLQRSWM